MSQENVELVSGFVRQMTANLSDHQGDRRSQAAKLQRGEVDPGGRAALDFLHPAVTWTTRIGEVYEGKLNCVRHVAEILEAWEEYAVSLRDITDLGGDLVLAEYEIGVRGAASGVVGNSTIFGVFALRDGLVSRIAEFSSRAEALKAVGLEEAVSQENVEIVRILIDQWNAGDRDLARSSQYVDPAIELESPLSSLAAEPYRGYAGIEGWMRDLDEQFAEWAINVDEVRQVRETVVATVTVSARGRASNAPLEFNAAGVFEFGNDARLMRVHIYPDVEGALKAVGLEE